MITPGTKLALVAVGSISWGFYLQSVSGGITTFCAVILGIRVLYDITGK